MEKDKLEPKLRFPGFTEPWEHRKLGNISKKCIVKNTNKAITETFTNSAEHGIVSQRDFFDKDIANQENISSYYVVNIGDFVYNPRISSSAPCGPISRNKLGRQGIMSPLYTVFSPSGVDLAFLEQYFKTSRWYSYMYLNGDTGARADRFAIKDKSFFDMPIATPSSLNEQEIISTFLDQTDYHITLHQRKEEELQKLKKGLLQKMFPKDGESVPEVRFPNFTDSWEHRKLATIATFAKGRGYSKNDLTDRGTPLILYGRLYTNYSSAIETVDTYAKPLIGSVYSKGGEVIVPASGETAEDIARASAVISKGFLLGGDLNIINPNSEIDPVFLALQLSNGYLKKELASKAQGKSVVHIHNSDLENLQIIYPSLVEQMKVSTCIRVFEHLITLHQRKTEELKKLKKALLQQMFV